MTCQTCSHAQKSTQQLNQYECWRYPPSVFPLGNQGGVSMLTMRPIMPAAAWCGEYQPAPQRAAAGAKMDA